jgi:hypothetical protein
LLFKLREVDHMDLIDLVGRLAPKPGSTGRKTITKDQLAGVFGIELETDSEINHSAPVPPAKPKRGGKFVTAEGSGKGQSETQKIRRDKTPASNRPAISKRKTLTAKERKQIAEAQRKRWTALREKWASKKENGYGIGTRLSQTTSRETAKGRPTGSANGKSTRRASAV